MNGDDLSCRPARLRVGAPADTVFIAEMMVAAGGGLFEQLLDGVVPGTTTAELLALAVAAPDGPFAPGNAIVAEEAGGPVAVALAFPGAELTLPDEVLAIVPAERIAPIAAVFAGAPAEALYLNTLAVRPAWAGRGHGRQLLAAVGGIAAGMGLEQVGLHCWARNAPALRLYAAAGFVAVAEIPIPATPHLPDGGPMLLMTAPAVVL